MINTKSQVYLLRNWLIQGKKIDCHTARMYLGIGHLPRRILDLKEAGMNIQSSFIKYTRKFDGNITHIKLYWLHNNSKMNSKTSYTPDNE